MAVKGLDESGKRKASAFVDVNQPEPFTWRPVSGSCPAGGSAQWSTPATTPGTAETNATISIGTFEPLRGGKVDGKDSGGIVEFGVTIGIKSSQLAPDSKLKLEASNKGQATWVQLDDGGIWDTVFALSTTEAEKTFAGYFPTILAFNKVPFDLQAVFQSVSHTVDVGTVYGAATCLAIARIKNSSYARGIFEPGT